MKVIPDKMDAKKAVQLCHRLIVSHLGGPQAVTMLAKSMEGESVRQIARDMGTKRDATWRTIRRAKARYRELGLKTKTAV